jgi:hypothetical protein
MGLIIGVMAVGIIVGCLDIINYKHKLQLSWISKLALFIMIFCLAAKIGCDKELLNHLGTLGRRSILLTFGIMTGAFLAVTAVRKIFAGTINAMLQEEKKS